MDPQVAWDGMLASYAEGEYETAEERASSLLEWMHRGGFPPTVVGNQELGPDFEKALAQAGCRFVLDAVTSRWATTEAVGTRRKEDA